MHVCTHNHYANISCWFGEKLHNEMPIKSVFELFSNLCCLVLFSWIISELTNMNQDVNQTGVYLLTPAPDTNQWAERTHGFQWCNLVCLISPRVKRNWIKTRSPTHPQLQTRANKGRERLQTDLTHHKSTEPNSCERTLRMLMRLRSSHRLN